MNVSVGLAGPLCQVCAAFFDYPKYLLLSTLAVFYVKAMLSSAIGDLTLVMLLGVLCLLCGAGFCSCPRTYGQFTVTARGLLWRLLIRQEAHVYLQLLHVSDIRITRYSGPYPGRGVSGICYAGYFPAMHVVGIH